MYSVVYNLFFYFKRREKKRRENGKPNGKSVKKILDYIEWYYNVVVRKCYIKFPRKKSGVYSGARKEKIIVSLTTWPKRIDTVWITIETLLRQTIKPDELILWLAEEQFDGLKSLPQELLRLQERGLTIRFCDDLRSHKKYFYTMQEYPNDIVILMDDDMFYPYDTIEKLWNLHQKYPNDICCITTQVMEPDFESMPSVWHNPMINEKIEHSNRVQIFTGSGSLFVPNALAREAYDKQLMKQLSPYADDLWLTYMAYRKGTRITSLNKWRAFPITIYGTSADSLWYINGQDGKNDEQWRAILEYFS